MSIQNEITRLQGVKSNILAAIEAKNVIVPPGAALADCPDLIAAITGGGGGGEVGVYAKQIVGESGIKVVDENGYVGLVVNKYFSHNGAAYAGNYAIVVEGADFSSQGLGRVTFVEYGTLEIGGLEYRTVTIGNQTWMAENLQLNVPNSWFYNNDEATYGRNGKNYGRLYLWDAAMGISVAGWHLPTAAEWDQLANAIGGSGSAGTKLKSTTDWSSGNGTDNYGFSVFPAGYRSSGSFDNLGSYANFWTASEYSSSSAYSRYFFTGASMNSYYGNKTSNAFSVRLVKDS